VGGDEEAGKSAKDQDKAGKTLLAGSPFLSDPMANGGVMTPRPGPAL
jgi:hypothetical protein